MTQPVQPTSTFHGHRSFGLTLNLPLHFPAMTSSQGPFDVEVRYGAVPDTLTEPVYVGPFHQLRPECAIFKLDDRLKFMIERGNLITIDRSGEIDDGSVRLFLTNQAIATLLHQRGQLAFHGAAVHDGQEAIILAGHSGIGKSTFAKNLIKRGWHFWTDEIAAVAQKNGRSVVYRGPAELQLWENTLRHFSLDQAGLETVREGLGKYLVPESIEQDADWLNIRAIVLIDQHNTAQYCSRILGGVEKIARLGLQTYRGEMVGPMGIRNRHLGEVGAVAANVELMEYSFYRGWDHYDQAVDALEKLILPD